MELWAITPEIIVGALVLVLLPLGPFLPARRKHVATWLAVAGLAVAVVPSAMMLRWPSRAVFHETYAVDPFAVYFKLVALAATIVVLLATVSRFAGRAHEAAVPPLLSLTCLGMIGLAASQDLVLIALFLQLTAVGSYTLVGLVKDDRRATEAALKLFLFSAVAGAVMLYGMTWLYGLTGTLRLPELAERLPAAPVATVFAALGLVVVGYGFKITLVPFHAWAPDTYQGAPTPIAGYLAVAPKAAALAVMARTLVVAFPESLARWPEMVAILAAVTMSVGNVTALRQESAKRLLAYSSIAQAGYLLVGVAAIGRDPLALPGLLVYLAVYLFMNLGAFLAVDAIERQVGSDALERFAGLGARLPWTAGILTVSLLSLAGIPPLGGFIGKTMLFGAALGAGWMWLAAIMAANVSLSLFYYVRVVEPLYLRDGEERVFGREPAALRFALIVLLIGTVASGVAPQPWLAIANVSSELLK